MNLKKRTILLFGLLCGAALFFVLNLMFGSVSIPLKEIWNTFFGTPSEPSVYQSIILKLRLPEAVAAAAAGAALGVAGLSMQTLFRNPLADPSILGVSSGASLGVALATLIAGNHLVNMLGGNIAILTAAFAGASVVLMLITLLAQRVGATTLLLIGVMVSYIVGSVTGILQFFASKEGLHSFVIWGMGSFKNVTMMQSLLILANSAMLLIAIFFQSKGLNAFVVGDEYAINSGIKIRRLTMMNVLLSGALVAVVTSFCGPIAFIGLMAPHFARMLFKTFDHRLLIPASMVVGIVLTLFCNLAASLPGTEKILPINAVTSIVGAPIIIFLILKRKSI